MKSKLETTLQNMVQMVSYLIIIMLSVVYCVLTVVFLEYFTRLNNGNYEFLDYQCSQGSCTGENIYYHHKQRNIYATSRVLETDEIRGICPMSILLDQLIVSF